MDFNDTRKYRMPTGEIVTVDGREMGWYQLGNDSYAFTVAPDGTVYEGMLTEGVTNPYRATGPATGFKADEIMPIGLLDCPLCGSEIELLHDNWLCPACGKSIKGLPLAY